MPNIPIENNAPYDSDIEMVNRVTGFINANVVVGTAQVLVLGNQQIEAIEAAWSGTLNLYQSWETSHDYLLCWANEKGGLGCIELTWNKVDSCMQTIDK